MNGGSIAALVTAVAGLVTAIGAVIAHMRHTATQHVHAPLIMAPPSVPLIPPPAATEATANAPINPEVMP